MHSKAFLYRASIAALWLSLFVTFAVMIKSWSDEGLVYQILRSDTTVDEKMEQVHQSLQQFGTFAPIAYVVLVTIEVVVAPIPGLMLYAPGGVLFGAFWGGTLSWIGNILGAGIACQLARSIRPQWLERCFDSSKAQQLTIMLERKGGWLILFLRLNPLTSSDLVSYAAGLTKIPVTIVMLATAVGMAPLCYLQAWLADEIFERITGLFYFFVGLLAVYAIVVVIVIQRVIRSAAPTAPKS